MDRYKLNREGIYLPFSGLTVVAAIQALDNDFWEKINRLITDCLPLAGYYAPLSNSSYHMTTMNLFTERSVGRMKWKDFIVSRTQYFELLKNDLEQGAFNPEITIESLEIDRTIRLVVNLPAQQKQLITDLAQKHHLLKKIPRPFHITLAYHYQHLDHAIKMNLEADLNHHLSQLLNQYKASLLLHHPKLCFFHDMNEFIPWENTSHYPF